MPDPAPITNPALSDIAAVGTGEPGPTQDIALPATLGVTDRAGNQVPDGSIASALAAGEAAFTPDRVYDLLNPDGVPTRVRGANVINALSQGYVLESPEGKELRLARENASFGAKVVSGLQGAGEGLTLGTLPALVEGFGGKEAARSYRVARAASPEAATTGELLSLLTPIGAEAALARGLGTASKLGRGALTAAEYSAPGLVSKLARKTGERAVSKLPEATGLMGRAARKGAQLGVEGAVEGSIYGAGYAVGEASLGDKELTAERLLAGAAGGALLGAGIGAGLGGAGSLVASGARKTADALPGFAEKMAFRSTGATGSQMRQVGFEQARRTGRRMLDEGLVGFGTLEERAAALRKAADDAGKDVGALIEKIDETGHKPQIAPILRKFDEQLGKLREGVGADVKLAKKLDSDFGEWFRERIATGKSPTFKELHKIRGRIDDHLEQAAKGQNTVVAAELRKLRANVEEEIQSQADTLARQAGDEFSNAYTTAKLRYKDLIKAAEIATKRAPEAAATSFTYFDKAAAVAGILTGNPAGILAAAGSNLARKHGDSAVALIADKLAKKTRKPPTLAEVLGGAPPPANSFIQGVPNPRGLTAEGGIGVPGIRPLGLDDVTRGKKPANKLALDLPSIRPDTPGPAAPSFKGAAKAEAKKLTPDEVFLTELKKLVDESPEGALLSVGDLRDRLKLPKKKFDATILKLQNEGKLTLHHSDNAGSLPAAERNRLVHDKKANVHYIGFAPTEAGSAELAKLAEVAPPTAAVDDTLDASGLSAANDNIPVDFSDAGFAPKRFNAANDVVEGGDPSQMLLGNRNLPGGQPANDVTGLVAGNDNFLALPSNDVLSVERFATANDNAIREQRTLQAKLEALGYVKEKADATAISMAKATKDATTKGAYKVVPKVPAGAGAYLALSADAQEYKANPHAAATKIGAKVEHLTAAAPQLAGAVNAKLTGDLVYLSQQLPEAGLTGLSPEQAKKIVPSGSDRASFVRKAEAIKDPKKIVIFDMKKGRLSDDALEAIKERRPLLLSQVIAEAEIAYAQMVAKGMIAPRQQRLQTEKLLSRTLDPASNPAVIHIVQQTYVEQAEAMATPPPPSPQSSSKRATRMMSYSEQIAYGEE